MIWFILFSLIWLIIGYFVVRWCHKVERLTSLTMGFMAIIVWPVTFWCFYITYGKYSTAKIIDKIFGKSDENNN